MLATYPTQGIPSERELRVRIDRCVARALLDGDFARRLLADPTLVVEDVGCTPQQYLDLHSIRADSLTDFARQAESLFWLSPPPALDQQPRSRPAVAAV